MELYIDLLQKGKKSKNKISFGIVWLLLGFVYFFSKIYARQALELTDYIFSIGFVLLGIFFLFQGFGKPLESYLGKSYFYLTKNHLKLKRTVFEKEKIYYWDKTEEINFNENKLYVDNLLIFDLSEINSLEDIQKIKELISEIASKKEIHA